MRNIINQITTQLTRDEGKRNIIYFDLEGNPTIGIGHNLKEAISNAAINQIFQDDLAEAESELQKNISWINSLEDVRYGALVNLNFNLGIDKLLEFKLMLAALQQGNYSEAAKQLLNSTYATEVGPRAQRLSLQIDTGVWQ